MKKWSKEDWVGVTVYPILVALFVGWNIFISRDFDTLGSFFIYIAYVSIVILPIRIVTNIISAPPMIAWGIIFFALLLAAMMLYKLLINPILLWTVGLAA